MLFTRVSNCDNTSLVHQHALYTGVVLQHALYTGVQL